MLFASEQKLGLQRADSFRVQTWEATPARTAKNRVRVKRKLCYQQCWPNRPRVQLLLLAAMLECCVTVSGHVCSL